MKKTTYLIGIMSGTSLDGVDASLIDSETNNLIKHISIDIDLKTKNTLLDLNIPQNNDLHKSKIAENLITKLYAKAYFKLIKNTEINTDNILAIGGHGQTIRHLPNIETPYTIQLLDGALLSYLTKQNVVCDFRSKDIAAGGQGAPLAPLFHKEIFKSLNNFAVVNIGGISNISCIILDKISGYDCGAGNCLLDDWIKKHKNINFDENGNWAKTGEIITKLLKQMLSDKYFALPSPKSTGRDYFNLKWLNNFDLSNYKANDIMRTITYLTGKVIANSINKENDLKQVIITGGGAFNSVIINDIKENLDSTKTLLTSLELKINPQHIEAIGFAWLAGQTMKKQKLNTKNITGANDSIVLGAVYYN